MPLRTCHLFAGAGGGLLADLILGHEPVVAVEWEPYPCQILRERAADGWFPELHVWEGDVRLFDPSEYAGRVDCIHAGFPCQDISNAGKQAGVGPETRSGLYREVLRIAGVVRPKYLFLENVSAIVTNGLDTVLSDLAALGYDSEWLCIRASDCGAKHHRDRWWLLADTNSHNRSTDERKPDARADRRDKPCGGCEAMADTKRKRQQRQGEYEQSERSAQAGYRETINAATGCGQEFWQVEPGLGRVADGVAYRVDRLKALGNGQVPLQAAVAWKLLGGP